MSSVLSTVLAKVKGDRAIKSMDRVTTVVLKVNRHI